MEGYEICDEIFKYMRDNCWKINPQQASPHFQSLGVTSTGLMKAIDELSKHNPPFIEQSRFGDAFEPTIAGKDFFNYGGYDKLRNDKILEEQRKAKEEAKLDYEIIALKRNQKYLFWITIGGFILAVASFLSQILLKK